MTRVAAVNPLTAIGVVLLIDLVLLLSLDAVTATAAVVLVALFAPLARVPLGRLAPRTAAVAVASVLVALTVLLYGRESGTVHLRIGLVAVSDGSIALAIATGLRLLAVALPAVVLLTDLDATRLADALGQRLHLPDRFVLAGLAGVRLFEVLGEDWRTIALARRARGVGDRGRVRRLPGQAFALLVVALRRAVALATAMEARGLGAPGPRTWSRPSRFGRPDLAVLLAGLVVAGGAVAAGLIAGTYRFVLLQ
ncbi:energy-coupling factor transporter transmembrane component T family protein [Amnibacterium setariae]|uniref:Energy-coupling factor transporter transmembrane protein EcfT n=1 Tax=Amnibacterium setariae TaxID=2306585 RepID=A0A3A1TWY4_9MICO|nr:energy-coupling factor transporter transmembrane component T [Amnibacterium setariae]RIX28290.1 energy-coupling factor transporter transmembrane protein EcfT [Amnibacterium setariae]